MLKHFKFNEEEINHPQENTIENIKSKFMNNENSEENENFQDLIYPKLTNIDCVNTALELIFGEKIRDLYQENLA